MNFNTTKFKNFFLIVTLVFLIIFANYPGYMSLDSTSQLQQARTMILNDGHPPAMALIWAPLDKMVPGPLLMLVLNAILHVCGVWLMTTMLPQLWQRYSVLLITILFVPTFFTIGAIWKDTLMNGFLLMGMGAVVKVAETTIKNKALQSVLFWVAIATLFIFLAVSQRHNAPAGAVVLLCPMILIIINVALKKSQFKNPSNDQLSFGSSLDLSFRLIVSTIVLAVAIIIVLFGSSVTFFDKFVTHKRNFWQVLAFYDLAGISIGIDRNLLPETVYPDSNLDILKKHYVPYSVLSLTKDSGIFYYIKDESDLKTLKDAWKKEILDNPIEYSIHRATIFNEVLGSGKIHAWAPIIIEPIPKIRRNLFAPKIAAFQTPMRKKLSHWIVRSDPIVYSPWFYFLLNGLMISFLLIFWVWKRCLSVKNSLLISFLVSGIGYELSLFFVAPSPDFRYSSYMIFTTIFGIAAILVQANFGFAKKR